jgi:hypothetical protein
MSSYSNQVEARRKRLWALITTFNDRGFKATPAEIEGNFKDRPSAWPIERVRKSKNSSKCERTASTRVRE